MGVGMMDAAWAAFVRWAFQQAELRQRFTAETGIRLYSPPKSPIDALIDQATGAPTTISERDLNAFVKWATVELWGLDDAPEAYRKEIADAP